MPSTVAVHKPAVQREGPAGGFQPDVHGQFPDGEHHSFSFGSSAVGRPSATHSLWDDPPRSGAEAIIGAAITST
jgi:hypothetical protein